MLADWIDSTKEVFAKVALRFGEENDTRPGSFRKTKDAQVSLVFDLPSLSTLLPYESIDEDLIFINKKSIGFGLFAMPVSGANEELVKSMAELLKNKLREGVDMTVMLYKHHHLNQTLEHGFEPLISMGGEFTRLAKMSLKYHKNAALSQYTNGRNINATLSDYQLSFFFSGKKTSGAIDAMKALRDSMESELTVAGLPSMRIEKQVFLTLMRAWLHPNLGALEWDEVGFDEDTLLSEAIPTGAGVFRINDLSIDVEDSDKEGNPYQTKIINCHIKRFPDKFALWQNPDLFANLLRPEHGIPCSFLMSFTIRGANQEKMQSLAKKRAGSLNSNANQMQHFMNPKAKDEQASWNFIHKEGSRDNLSLLPTFYNLVLYTTPEKELEVVSKTISAYRQMGFELQQSRATQWLRYLASLPYFMSEGFFDDFKALGLINTMTNYNAANLLPVVADLKGSKQGMLLPTARNQLYFLDMFDNKNLPITNFNAVIVGSPGSGKSMFQQGLILSGLSLGEMTYVIDLGGSYKHLCELVGGTYVDVSTITLNPFTLFDFEGRTQLPDSSGAFQEVSDNIQIRDLLAIMASPHTALCDVQKSYLLDASVACWQKFKRKSSVDDVIAALSERLNANPSYFDARLNDLIILLQKYSSTGIYGFLFNGEAPIFNQSKFVVFEMGGFRDNPDLLTIVMFVMIVFIQGQFYQTDRTIKKRCNIDEAWRFIVSGDNPIAANFIEQGFRTARKHNGGFSVMTQYLLDLAGTIQGQAISASSDIEIIMRQGKFEDFIAKFPDRFDGFQTKMIQSFEDVISAGFSSMMVKAGKSYSFHRYFADNYTRILFSSSGVEFEAVEALVKKGVALSDAVSQVAIKRFGVL